MLDALAVFVERHHLGDGLFLTLIATHDELKFDTHTKASPGSSDRRMIRAIVPKLIHNPQHLPALNVDHRLTGKMSRGDFDLAQTEIGGHGLPPQFGVGSA